MKLSFRTKLSYGVGGICDNALYTLSGTYLLLYLTTVAGISPAIAGTITAIGSIWEALCGPIVGFKSDGTRTRFGRRKPFLLMASFPVAIITSLLFTAIDASMTVKVIYYTVMIILFWTSFSSEFIPYMAWGSDLTEDYHERTVLRSYAYVFNQVGMCIGMVLPTVIVDYCMNLGRTTAQSWQMVGIFTGVCSGAALLLCALTIHKDDKAKKDFVKPEKKGKFLDLKQIAGMFKEYFEILKLKPIQFIIGSSVVYLVANTVFSSDRVFYMTYNLGMSQKEISMMMLIITVSGVVFVPFIAKLAGAFDKKTVFMCGIGGAGVCLMASRFIGVNSLTAMIVICLIYSVANTCYWQLLPSMLYDVCEVEELISGQKRSGAVISLQALSESLSIAVAMQGLGIVLEMAGFVSDAAVQPETALTWVSNCFTFLPGLFMVLVVVMISRYPINKKVFTRVMDALERRKQGIEVDVKEFEDIFE
ncbi:MAG: MFS transporter [Firmicutes bacterium]|nr:MFS transporter [Bacillota bacterium]MDD7602931.1 MFS transporter [Bacillota bacterium]MDY5856923.1 MFS transporter [Anaerovoracaceae bacterium]